MLMFKIMPGFHLDPSKDHHRRLREKGMLSLILLFKFPRRSAFGLYTSTGLATNLCRQNRPRHEHASEERSNNHDSYASERDRSLNDKVINHTILLFSFSNSGLK
jgi:hypothetical protein